MHLLSVGLYGASSFWAVLSAPFFCWPLQQCLLFGEGSPESLLGA